MCETSELVPIPQHVWDGGGIFQFDETHPEYGINEAGEKCLVLDTCIIPAIKALWDAGIVTISCCCGHSEAKYSVITLKRPVETDTYVSKNS